MDPTYEDVGDDGMGKQEKVFAWMRPNDNRPTDLLLLSSTGRKYFKTSGERKEWKALQDMALGADDGSIMFDAWIRHNIDLARKANMRQTVRTLPWVLTAIKNESRRVDWVAANRERILKERANALEEQFFTKRK